MSVDIPTSSTSPKKVDLLIIGAGPAGLALANWFRGSLNTSVLLVDQKPSTTPRGAAEGLKSTTVEIFESFGIGPQVWAELWRLEEIAIWGHDKSKGEGIYREQVMADCVPELGKTRETMLQQARVEWHMYQNLSSSLNIEVQWCSTPTSIVFEEADPDDIEAYPVKVELASSGEVRTNGSGANAPQKQFFGQVTAKYVVGCDGARSWLRRQLGVKLEGDLTDSVFGVVDIVPKTNFPDVRKVCYLKATSGTILLVPRSNKEVRLYIPVESGSSLSDPKDLTFDRIMDAARKIISPYTLEVANCSWWSAYRVGQRVGDHFWKHKRAFLVGDAVHTHSPKAGQGMNTSVQDAYNLGWKLRHVLSRLASPSVLETYEAERRPVAQDLIAFDRGYLKLFSAPTSSFDSEFLHAMKFTTGLSIRYPSSQIVQLPKGQTVETQPPSLLKADVISGKRLPDFQIVNQSDATTTRIHQRLQATGSFRLIVFAGDIAQSQPLGRLQDFGRWLADPSNRIGKLTAASAAADATAAPPGLEVLVVHSADRHKVQLMELHEVFRPWTEESGWDYWRVYADTASAHEGHGRAYERLEIVEKGIYAVVVRPDGYVGAVAGIEGTEEEIERYFAGISLR